MHQRFVPFLLLHTAPPLIVDRSRRNGGEKLQDRDGVSARDAHIRYCHSSPHTHTHTHSRISVGRILDSDKLINQHYKTLLSQFEKHTHTHTAQENLILFTITWHSTVVKTVLDSWWQIKRVRAGGRERWECRDVSLEAAFFSMHVDPVRLECNNRIVGPLGRRKEPGNSLWLPSIYHRRIDCRWENILL